MPIHFFELSPPLSESLLSAALGGGYRVTPSLETATRFAFHAPAALIGDVQCFDWIMPDPPPRTVSDSPSSPADSGTLH